MVNQTYINFIDKLIIRTKAKMIKWEYLDDNPRFCEEAGFISDSSCFTFNTGRSFRAYYRSMNIVILQKGTVPSSLHVIPITFKNIVVLSPKEYGEYITRLQNLVASGFPDAENFIESIADEDEDQPSD